MSNRSKYLTLLYQQFCDAYGFKYDSEHFKDDKLFAKWIIENKNIGNIFFRYLRDLGVFDSHAAIETDKGVFDTLENDKIVTSSLFYTSPSNARSKIVIKDNKPFLFKNEFIDLLNHDMLFTHNPYSSDLVESWDKVHNNGIYSINLGVYGKTTDEDAKAKIKFIEDFAKKLDGGFVQYKDTNKDMYFSGVISDRRILRKYKTK